MKHSIPVAVIKKPYLDGVEIKWEVVDGDDIKRITIYEGNVKQEHGYTFVFKDGRKPIRVLESFLKKIDPISFWPRTRVNIAIDWCSNVRYRPPRKEPMVYIPAAVLKALGF